MRRWVSVLVAALVAGSGRAAETPREILASGATPSVEAVTALLQDRAGFLWVGSREGLILFDGYTSRVFEHDVADPGSLSDNAIRAVFEDRQGRLWIATNAGGLNELSRATWTFHSYRHDSADPKSISNDSVYAIAQDAAGFLWVGTQNGLDRFDPGTGTFERLDERAGGPSHPYVDALLAARDGGLWAGTVGGGLNRCDPATRRCVAYRHDPRDPGSLASDDIFAIVEEASGRLDVGTGVGVDRFDPATGRAEHLTFDGPPRPAGTIVTALANDREGALWVATFDTGLWSAGPGAARLAPHRHDEGDSTVDRLICLLAGQDGTLWVGSWGSGLIRVPRDEGRFVGLAVDRAGTGTAVADTTAVLEDRAGNLWIGEPAALVRRDPAGRVTRFPQLDNALALHEMRSGVLVVATAGQLAEIDPATGRILARTPSSPDPGAALGPGWVWAIAEDSAGGLWVGTGGGGLSYRPPGGRFERLRHDPSNPASLSDDYVVALLQGRDGTLWVGTRSGGLNARPPGAAAFVRCAPRAGDPRSISHHSVSALLEGADGTIWVGTGGGGLDRVVREPGGSLAFVRSGESEGLIDDNVVSLAEDADGTLWIGTRRGLSRFDPASGLFAGYAAEDGLPSVEFATGAAARGRSSLYFGTHRGAIAVASGTPFPRAAPSPTVFTSARALSGSPSGDLPPDAARTISIPYGESLSFETAVLDFGDRRRHRYAYRLEGLTRDWIDLGSRREVTLTHLDPATYRLHARGRNAQGVWSETPTPIVIRIVPPFWMTGWFRAAAVLAVAGAALAAHRLRTAALEARNRQLVRLKDERERALEEANESQGELNRAYGRLRGLTRRLEAAKEDERKRIARELHDEMGQVLTTAKLNLQLLPGAGSDRDRRVGDAIGLLDRLIGRVRALSLDLRPPLLDELGLAAALRGYGEAQSRRSGVAIAVDAMPSPPRLPPDVEIAAFRVVQEAVTNVLRHAAASRIEIGVRYDRDAVELSIADDGRGFDVAAALEGAAEGRHLGLLGMKERVESMRGRLTIDAASGRGTTIRARIPWEA